MAASTPTNAQIAAALAEVSTLLTARAENPFKVRAWRRGADVVRSWPEPMQDLLAAGGIEALEALPGIGRHLAQAIAELLETGRLVLLDSLRGEAEPEALIASLPSIGPELAGRIATTLGVGSLEELELAAHDGRLEQVPGIGPRRARAVRDQLAARLSRTTARRAQRRVRQDAQVPALPPVSLLLAVDETYRQRAGRGTLPLIAPRRFNPEGTAWLPVLRETRSGWHLTAMFSNTALAHRLERTGDWVVVYYTDSHGIEDQATVVTEARGPLAGLRVVRGREGECAQHYRAAAPPTAS